MSQYTIYDPSNSITKLFTLDHVNKQKPEELANLDQLIIVEDAHLKQLIESCKGKVRALFLKEGCSATDFCDYRKKADFVLELPTADEEMFALMEVLEGHFLQSDVDMSAMLPPEMLEKYNKSIDEKIQEVESIIQAIAQNPTKELLMELRNSVHKFAGSAASYGYIATTPLCRAHEAFLESCYEAISKEKVIEANRKFYRKFKLTMQKLNLKPMTYTLGESPS